MDHDIKKLVALWAPFRGKVGTEFANIQYARSLRRSGYEVILISLLDEYDDYEHEFKVVRLWSKKFYFIGRNNFFYRRDFFILALLSTRRLNKVLCDYEVDVVVSSLLSSVACKAAKSANKRLLISIQGYPKFLLKKDNFLSAIENFFRKIKWRKNYVVADKLICMTEYTQKKLSRAFPKLQKNILHISNPLFDDEIEIKVNKQCDCTKTRVIFVGRYSYQKDFPSFVKIANYFEFSNLNFEVYGEFPDSIINQYENIIFHGYQPRFWDCICPSCTVHVVTAQWEDPGHAILEGLQLGVRTIILDRDAPHVQLGSRYGAHVTSHDESIQLLDLYLLDKKNILAPDIEQRKKLTLDYGVQTFSQRLEQSIG